MSQIIAFIGCLYYGVICLMTPHLQSTHLVLLMQVSIFDSFHIVLVCVCLLVFVFTEDDRVVVGTDMSATPGSRLYHSVVVHLSHSF